MSPEGVFHGRGDGFRVRCSQHLHHSQTIPAPASQRRGTPSAEKLFRLGTTKPTKGPAWAPNLCCFPPIKRERVCVPPSKRAVGKQSTWGRKKNNLACFPGIRIKVMKTIFRGKLRGQFPLILDNLGGEVI